MNSRKLLPYFILAFIIGFSFFKYWFVDFCSDAVSGLLNAIGGDPGALLDFLNRNANYTSYQDHLLGLLIYYPIFFGLHYLFIFTLFTGRNRRITMLIVTGVVLLLLSLIAIGKLLDIQPLFSISFAMFQNLFALPFLLLAIEGGRILLSDIEKKLDH